MSSCSESMSEVMRGDDPARLLAFEEVERQRHQVVEQSLAQLAQERLADARDEQDREPAEEQRRRTPSRGRARPRGSAQPASSLAHAVVDAVAARARAREQRADLQPSSTTTMPSDRGRGTAAACATSRRSDALGVLARQRLLGNALRPAAAASHDVTSRSTGRARPIVVVDLVVGRRRSSSASARASTSR